MFKVGDRVKIVKTPNIASIYDGLVGFVENIISTSNGIPYYVIYFKETPNIKKRLLKEQYLKPVKREKQPELFD